jgi:hypothetical protein
MRGAASFIGPSSPAILPGTAPAGRADAALQVASDVRELPLTYLPDSGATTLVLYVYAETDSESRHNLDFFVREAIVRGNADMPAAADEAALGAGSGEAATAADRADYLLLLQHDDHHAAAAAGRLPALPSNARYIWHQNECYDWGTFGWLVGAERRFAAVCCGPRVSRHS